MNGFSLTCLRCGETMIVKPGDRDREREPIRFGTATETYTFMKCRCGNAIEDYYHWENENEDDEPKLIDRWIDASEQAIDESTVYGNDCPGGKCGM